MKLAEALLMRSEYQTKLDNLQKRILANLKVQELERPLEDPVALLSEMLSLQDSLCTLVQKINARNHATHLPSGISLANALTEREAIIKKRTALSVIAGSAMSQEMRIMHTELRTQVTLPVPELHQRIDALSKAFRELDTQIQSLNWTVDLE